MVFELRYNIVIRYAIRYFCGGFPNEKMTAWLNGETDGLFSFWVAYAMY